MTARPRSTVLVALLLVGAALTGCTSSSDSQSGSSDSQSGEASAATGTDAAGSAGMTMVEPAPAQPGAVTAGDLQLPRDVVRTAGLDLEVSDLRATADRARELAEAAGGGLEAEDASGDASVLRLRVLPDRLPTALDALSRLGRETRRTVGSENVSGQVADLDGRLTTQRASVERVRELLARAQVLSDIVTLEGQLTQRQSELESLQARVKALRATADLATITLTLTPPATTAAATSDADFASGLEAGLSALYAAARIGAAVLGALLPFLPLLLVGAYVARRLRRRTPAAG
ncbi:MAG TPA: DUF4349 domain-containing protein [Mycobacteriales bacterium]|nr:DUF4349 domain-containing protein [Mycobacteriales bacterium]